MTGPGIGLRSEWKNCMTLEDLQQIDPIAAHTLIKDVGVKPEDFIHDYEGWLLFSRDGRVLTVSDNEVDYYTYSPNKRYWTLYWEPSEHTAKKWPAIYPSGGP
jgi:hypothetical protein